MTSRTDHDLLSIRNRLYEADTEGGLEEFVAENPAGPGDDLETVRGWTAFEFGEFVEFVVVGHLTTYAVVLDRADPPRAYGMRAPPTPFEAFPEEGALPVMVSRTALLPFDGAMVDDGWLSIRPIVLRGHDRHGYRHRRGQRPRSSNRPGTREADLGGVQPGRLGDPGEKDPGVRNTLASRHVLTGHRAVG